MLQEDVTPGSFAAALVHASRQQVDRLVLYADKGAALAARLEQWFRPEEGSASSPSVEVRFVDGSGSEPAAPEPMPVVLPGPAGADPLLERLRSAGLEVVLEQGEWRGELLGLEVARVVRWPPETGGDGELHIEPGVGRFDRDAAAAMHQGESPDEGLRRASAWCRSTASRALRSIPSACSRGHAGCARWRWRRQSRSARPTWRRLRPPSLPTASVTNARPGALGRTTAGVPVLVVFGAGSALELLAVAADTRELHLPAGLLRVVLAPKDRLAIVDELAQRAEASGRGPVELIEMEPPWAA
ncbi:MAG: hypothetical protein M5U19_19995 [Microthrixaceae bacterium]|nr:hypothetical protein [Microthrixaceae bacterium]